MPPCLHIIWPANTIELCYFQAAHEGPGADGGLLEGEVFRAQHRHFRFRWTSSLQPGRRPVIILFFGGGGARIIINCCFYFFIVPLPWLASCSFWPWGQIWREILKIVGASFSLAGISSHYFLAGNSKSGAKDCNWLRSCQGLYVQSVIEALRKSNETRAWTKVSNSDYQRCWSWSGSGGSVTIWPHCPD